MLKLHPRLVLGYVLISDDTRDIIAIDRDGSLLLKPTQIAQYDIKVISVDVV